MALGKLPPHRPDADQIGTELQRGRQGAVGAVYEILMREAPDPDELR